jgi:asparagine synthase (glutamine-hydrolysing)
MCGIAGLVGHENYDLPLRAMLKSQAHRGPDFTGVYYDKNFAALGHNRLSIIDLSSQANQPFTDHSKRYYIVFNGEIYNYLELRDTLKNGYNFKTQSDTEVLLAIYIKYGKSCLNMLNGMFSFAIWDAKEKTLFAARDRFGVKPFYYHQNANTFIFSSEIKAIHKSGVNKTPNQNVWDHYFVHGSYGLPNETFWDHIYQLPAGHYLEYQEGNLVLSKWYDFVDHVLKQPQINNYKEAQDIYRDLLFDSIKLRFRADTSIGFNISGGLDSSALLALVNQSEINNKNIEAFTFYTNNEQYDELPWVQQMISRYSNPLNKVLLSSKEVSELSETISNFQDEPFGGIPTLAYSKLFKAAKEKGIKVLLDGQGMDEQLAGYDYYTSNSQKTIQGVTKSPYRPHMLNSKIRTEIKKHQYPKPFLDQVQNLQYRDLFYTKIPRALRFNDRISMAYSTELREPFLDYRLVEFGFSLPLEFKIKDEQNKRILRDIISEYIPNTISYAPKRPLQTPQREWLASELSSYVTTQIELIKDGKYNNWFDFVEVDLQWQNYLNGDQQSSFYIWQLINFSLLMS